MELANGLPKSYPVDHFHQSRLDLGDSPEQSDFDHLYIPPRISNPSSSQYTSFNAVVTLISRILLVSFLTPLFRKYKYSSSNK